MFVLTLTSGQWSDAETSVVGVFDTLEAMTSAKDAEGESVDRWEAWEIPETNRFHAPGELGFHTVLSHEELARKEEQARLDAYDLERRAAHARRLEAESARKRADLLAALERKRGHLLATVRASGGSFSSAPTDVIEFLDDVLSDVERSRVNTADPFRAERMQALRRRLALYARQSAAMREKLDGCSAEDVAEFDAVMDCFRDNLGGGCFGHRSPLIPKEVPADPEGGPR